MMTKTETKYTDNFCQQIKSKVKRQEGTGGRDDPV